MILQEKIKQLQELAELIERGSSDPFGSGCDVGARNAAELGLSIINQLQQTNELFQLSVQAAQEIVRNMNQEKSELIKALNYIRSCDSATQSAAKAIETLKKYETI